MISLSLLLDTDDDLQFASERVSYLVDLHVHRRIDEKKRVQTIGELRLVYRWRQDANVTDLTFGRWVRLLGTINGNQYEIFTGLIERVEYLDRDRAEIVVKMRSYFFDFPVGYGLQVDKRTDEIMEVLLATGRSGIRSALRSPGGKLYARARRDHLVGSVVVGHGTVVQKTLDAGKSTVAYYGDLEETTAGLRQAIDNLVMTELGWFYEEADGTIRFRKRSHTSNLTTAATLTQSEIQMQYAASVGGVAKVIGEAVPREASENALVMTLADDWRIRPGSHRFRKRVIDPEGRSVGVYGEVTASNVTLTVDLSMNVSAQGNALEFGFLNKSQDVGIVSAGAQFRCNAIYQTEPEAFERLSDQYGGLEVLDIGRLFDSGDKLAPHVNYLIEVYGGVRQRIEGIEFVDEDENQIALELLDAVQITITTPALSERYLVGGIEQDLKGGRLITKIEFIPFLDDAYAIVGVTGRMEVGYVKVGY